MAMGARSRELPEDERVHNPSVVGTIMAVIMVTLAAAAAGSVFGMKLQGLSEDSKRGADSAEVETVQSKPNFVEQASVRPLPPIITNLAGQQRSWVRIEASLLLAREASDDDGVLAARVAEDIVAYLQTVSVSDIEGASGFQHVRDDLKDRARIRSEGRARDLVIHTFIIE